MKADLKEALNILTCYEHVGYNIIECKINAVYTTKTFPFGMFFLEHFVKCDY